MWQFFKVLGYTVKAKVYDVGSEFGIKEIPRISKMSVGKDGQTLLHYDRGWDFNHMSQDAYERLVDALEALI